MNYNKVVDLELEMVALFINKIKKYKLAQL